MSISDQVLHQLKVIPDYFVLYVVWKREECKRILLGGINGILDNESWALTGYLSWYTGS